jgi:hypothetical protein
MAGGLHFADHLVNLEVAFIADLFQGALGIFIKLYAEVIEYVSVDIVLIHQFTNELIL